MAFSMDFSAEPSHGEICKIRGSGVEIAAICKYAENGKVAIRNIRRDAMESFKKKEKASEITEDDLKQAEKDLQKLTDDSSKKIDELLARKEKELMEI